MRGPPQMVQLDSITIVIDYRTLNTLCHPIASNYNNSAFVYILQIQIASH